jgi:hypothetical protein
MTRTCLATPEEPGDSGDQAKDAFAEFERACQALSDLIYQPGSYKQATYMDAVVADYGVDCIDTLKVYQVKTTINIYNDLGDAVREDPFAHEIRKSLLAHYDHRKRGWRTHVSPQNLTHLAALLAGRERAAVVCEWCSHLSGETGRGLPEDRQVREAAGFVLAAIRFRLQDTADCAWRPVDALLASRTLSNLFVFFATLVMALFFVHHGGSGALAGNLEGMAVVWASAFGVIHVGRKWRDVKPPEHKPRKGSQ